MSHSYNKAKKLRRKDKRGLLMFGAQGHYRRMTQAEKLQSLLKRRINVTIPDPEA